MSPTKKKVKRLDDILDNLTSAAFVKKVKSKTPVKKKMVKSPKSKTPVKKKMVKSPMKKLVKSKPPAKKTRKCGSCLNCTKVNCGVCVFCQDMPKFGGPGKMKQACKSRKCLGSSSSTSIVSTMPAGDPSTSRTTSPPPVARKRIMAPLSNLLVSPPARKNPKKTAIHPWIWRLLPPLLY